MECTPRHGRLRPARIGRAGAVYITVIPSSIPMQAWHDYPVVKDMPCGKCGTGPVHVMLTTAAFRLYLQCEHCGNHWSDPDRRATLRVKIVSRDPQGS
jgi:hypothetical protein